MAQIRAAASRTGDIFQVFPLGEEAREEVVGSTWIDLLGGSTADLWMIDIPDETRLVVIYASSDDLAGTIATGDQASKSWKLRAGTWQFCLDRDLGAAPGPKFFLAIDPRDATAGVSETSTVTLLSGATG